VVGQRDGGPAATAKTWRRERRQEAGKIGGERIKTNKKTKGHQRVHGRAEPRAVRADKSRSTDVVVHQPEDQRKGDRENQLYHDEENTERQIHYFHAALGQYEWISSLLILYARH